MIDRRQLLRDGGLLVGFALAGCKSKKKSAAKADNPDEKDPVTVVSDHVEDIELSAYIRIDTAGVVTLIVAESEMGQGVLTSLPMIMADELGADWSRVRSEHALANRELYGWQSTGGSTSVRLGYDDLRHAAASVREMLVSVAAERWGVPAEQCTTAKGEVLHEPSDRRVDFGELATDAAKVEPPAKPALRSDDSLVLIGKPTPRLDTAIKARGEAVFGIDVSLPDMLVAQVERCPIFGGSLGRFDAKRAEKVPGVERVVEIPSGVAIVAVDFWAATKGREALTVEWNDGGNAGLSSASLRKLCERRARRGAVARNDGNVRSALRGSGVVEAVYEVPYLAHAPMEPLNCTAHVREDGVEVWAPTQSPSGVRDVAAEITGLDLEKVVVHTTFLGGGFGRRSQTDFAAEAVHLSKAMKAPVKVIWTREDGVRAGYYRPMAYNVLRGKVEDGTVRAWMHEIASPSILGGMGRELEGGIDPTSAEGAANIPYAIDNVRVTWADVDAPIPVWFWRSVGSSQNAYVTECFLDELARAASVDPVALRRKLLVDKPRHRTVLDKVVAASKWEEKPPAGRARGVAVHESFGSIAAQVAEVSLENDRPRVHHVWCAIDCGHVVNPMTIEEQVESGIVFGLSAALFGKVSIAAGRAEQGNFDDYPVVRMRDMPEVHTEIVASGDEWGGIGEPATPPIAPAVANALFALRGTPVRRLPMVG